MSSSGRDEIEPLTALAQGPAPSWQVLASRYLGEYLDKIRLATARLPEDLVWWRPHSNALSVGNLILHLQGNLSLWILGGLGDQMIARERAREFSADRTHGSQELLRLITETTTRARELIEGVTDGDAARPAAIQGYDVDVRGAIFHAVEHMSYHTGQILYIVKTLTAEDEAFDFYSRHRDE